MFITGLRTPEIFGHRENRTVRERIMPGVICPDGKQEVIELITDMLELLSIKDHIMDYEADLANEHSNPLNTEIIYYLSRKIFLETKIRNYSGKALLSDLLKQADPFYCGHWACQTRKNIR